MSASARCLAVWRAYVLIKVRRLEHQGGGTGPDREVGLLGIDELVDQDPFSFTQQAVTVLRFYVPSPTHNEP